MALQLLLDERETALQNLNSQVKNNEQIYQQQKQELEYSINKRQRHIEQVIEIFIIYAKCTDASKRYSGLETINIEYTRKLL